MPFQIVSRSDHDTPLWFDDEEVLCKTDLVYLYTGENIRTDTEGRGTLFLTSHRILFLSDEDREKNLTWGYEDFDTHALSLSKSNWAHKCLLCKITQPDEEDEDGEAAEARWTRRRPKHSPFDDADDDEQSDEEQKESAVAPWTSSARKPVEEEDFVVRELRFVPPKPDTQLKEMYEAWNRGDELNVDHDAEDGSDAEADEAPARSKQLDRLDRLLIVSPVKPSAIAAELPQSAAIANSDDDATQAPVSSESCAACTPPATLRACSACVRDRPECHYSGAQLKRKGKRICRACVARKEGTALPALHEVRVQPAVASAPAAVSSSAPSTASSAPVQPSGQTQTALDIAAVSRSALFQSIMQNAAQNIAELNVKK